jgi:hypothetical protein
LISAAKPPLIANTFLKPIVRSVVAITVQRTPTVVICGRQYRIIILEHGAR